MQTLSAQARHTKPKSVLKKLRVEGRVPGVVYGPTIGNHPVSIDEGELTQHLRYNGKNAVFTLQLDKQDYTVMVWDMHEHPTRNRIEHVDLIEVNMKEEMVVEVYVETTGESPGEKEGGILQRQYQTVEVKCLPGNIPEKLEVDVSGLNIGDSLTAADLNVPEGVVVQLEADAVIVSVVPPAKEVVAEAEDGQEEPELVAADDSANEETGANEEADENEQS